MLTHKDILKLKIESKIQMFIVTVLIDMYSTIKINKLEETIRKLKQITKLTLYSQLVQHYFSPTKLLYFVYDEVRAECPKLGHANPINTYHRSCRVPR